MNIAQASRWRYAKDKQTGIVYEYEYVGMLPSDRHCYIRIIKQGEYHCVLAKGFEVSTETEYQKQQLCTTNHTKEL